MAYVKSTILNGLQAKDSMIRQTSGTVIMALLSNEEAGGWPEALDALTKGMGSQDENVVEVCPCTANLPSRVHSGSSSYCSRARLK